MILNNIKIVVLLYLYSSSCISQIDMELIEGMKKFMPSSIYCNKKGLSFFYYDVVLYDLEKNDNVPVIEDIEQKEATNNIRKLRLEINDKESSNNLIKELKERELCNKVVTFHFIGEKNNFTRFITSFIERLEENNVDKVEIMCNNTKSIKNFYEPNVLYFETYNNSLSIKERKIFLEGDSLVQKRNISNEYLTNLMQENYNSYFGDIEDVETSNMLKKYFFNSKLLLLDKDSFEDEAKKLNSCKIDELSFEIFKEKEEGLNKVPDMKYLHILFYFLKDSDIFKSMILNVLNCYQSKKYFLFRKIVRSLEIYFVDGYQILSSNTLGDFYCPIINLNKYIIDEIFDKIRKIKITDGVSNYKRLLIFFYYFLKSRDEEKINKFLRIIKEHIIKYDYVEKNKEVFKRNVRYLLISYERNYIFSLVYEVYGERKGLCFPF